LKPTADRHTVVGWEGTEQGGDLNEPVNNDHNVHIKAGAMTVSGPEFNWLVTWSVTFKQ
jgi:hypothetical protein